MKNDEWFICTITNTEKHIIKSKPDFVKKGGTYAARVYFDDNSINNKSRVGISEIKVDSETKLDIPLKASGRQAIWIYAL
jgi:alpha-glucosidase